MSTTTFPATEPLTPLLLAQKLLIDGCDLEELVEDCQMEAELLAKLLYSREFQDHLKLRIDLAITCAKLQAAEALPGSIEVLEKLTHSPKPEVARRAAMTILGIVGLPTKPTAPAPAPLPAPPLPAPPPEPTPQPPSSSSHKHQDRPAPAKAPPPIENQKSKIENPPTPNINQKPNDSAPFAPLRTPAPVPSILYSATPMSQSSLPPLPFPLSPSSPPDFLTSSLPHSLLNTPHINQNPNVSTPFLPPPSPLPANATPAPLAAAP